MSLINELEAAFPNLVDITKLIDGEGGQKVVFRATLDDAPVVLKLLRRPLSGIGGEQTARRVDREVLASSTLNSRYVPRVLDSGVTEIGGSQTIYIIEDYVEGRTLKNLLDSDGQLTPVEVCWLLRQLLLAAVDFENAKLVHRDIKPANLIIGADQSLWVIDFGLVRFLDLQSLTADAQLLGPGTYGYAAPEQQSNQKRMIDIRADLFSIGVVAYEALTGANPYLVGMRDPIAVITAVRTQDLPPITLSDPRCKPLAEFIQLLTGRYPNRRPETARLAMEQFAPMFTLVTGQAW